MTSLPITPVLPDILEKLESHENLVLQADPGAGKSTAVPLAILESDWFNRPENRDKKIVMLEPRRLAARSIARYLAAQLGESVGERVGFQVRNERRVSKQTRLEIVTEGVLTRRIQNDPELAEVALVIFDEFHERSIQADLSLALCLDVQEALRDDLKLLVMSATIDTAEVSRFLKGAPVIRSQGRAYPVEMHYLPKAVPSTTRFKFELLPLLKSTLIQAVKASEKDTLVFLPGQGEIKQALEAAKETFPESDWSLVPLYGGLKPQEQDRAIVPDADGRRKIVFTTNVAETSLTIEGVDCVVDSGLARVARFDVNSGMTRLETQRISAASAEQRKGRAGRLQAGCCYRLWSESQQAQLKGFEEEEIRVTDLSDLVLELALWGVASPEELRWLTPPPDTHFARAQQLLKRLDLVNEQGQVSELGQRASGFGASPRLARMLLAAKESDDDQLAALACDVAALLAERDVLLDAREAGADLALRVQALRDYRADRKRAKQYHSLRVAAMEQALQNSRNWQRQLGLEKANETEWRSGDLGRLVAWAFPDRIGLRRNGGQPRYQLANGKGAALDERDPLGREACLAVAEIDGHTREGRIFLATAYSVAELESQFESHIETRAGYEYDAQRNAIDGVELKTYEALVLERRPLKQFDAEAFQSCLIETLKAQKLAPLPWNEKVESWLARVRWLVSQAAEEASDWPDFSEAALNDGLDEWLSPYLAGINSLKALKGLDLLSILQSRLDYEQQQAVEREAPEFYNAPSGKQLRIRYATGQNPTVSVPLQELFGEVRSPRLAWNRVPLTFELLSPAKRPIQVTADLENFWQSSYFEVAKEMRGRYPKHRWPEQPLKEKAGRSIKKR